MCSGPCILGMKINEQVKQNHVKPLVELLFYKLEMYIKPGFIFPHCSQWQYSH